MRISDIDTSNINLSNINPFRYRSYYYDNETGLYYINSRYYNPIWNKICVVQVPHHGSRNNFDNQLIIPSAAHVISNKEFPYRRSDVKYQKVWDEIRCCGENVVGTWQEPLR